MDNSKPCNEKRACKDCAFWETMSNGLAGHCHRYPPTNRIEYNDKDTRFHSIYLETLNDDWCGEFQHIKEHAVDNVKLAEDTTHTPFE